ncbi:MAG: hypothetical protein ACREFV_00745 [Acetobacteraceae bacterium]
MLVPTRPSRVADPARMIGRILLTVGLLIAAAHRAEAHAFGIRYNLPVPLGLYLLGAGAAVAVSFVVIALFVRAPALAPTERKRRLLPVVPERWRVGEVLSVFLFLLVIASGWFGNQNPLRNFAPVAVWIIFWVAGVYVCTLVGNLWAAANPWAALFAWAEALARRPLSLGLRYPAWLDCWPGIIFLIGFVWIELIFPYSASPFWIATLAALYSLVTWIGMAIFGRTVWLERGEGFALYFGVYARLSPFSRKAPPSKATPALILFILSSVMFDGFLDTPLWTAIAKPIPGPPTLAESLGLIVMWLLFLAAYYAISALMAVLAGREHSTGEVARDFAYTLVPIALAYQIAHYLTYLLIQGQYIIALASDPFGRGWNVLGTLGYRVNIAIVGPQFAWFSAVGAIVIGHIAAISLAHRRALGVFSAPRPALRSQYAMTALMVGFTVFSLTIIAQPIVENVTKVVGPPPASVAVPADAIAPVPGSGLFQAVGPGHRARAHLRFQVLLSPFHDGTEMTAADVLYAYSFAWRWSSGQGADPAVAATTALARKSLVGLKVVGTNSVSKAIRFANLTLTRPLLVVDVYANVNPDDPDSTAAFAPPWTTVPWTVLTLMNEAAKHRWAAFSEAEARREGVPWLDLVRDPRLEARLDALVKEFARTGYRPRALESMVSVKDARARWTALGKFYQERHHLLVTNGPYELKSWSDDGATLTAWRDLRYPLGVGSFDYLPIPRRAYITKVQRAPNGDLRLSVEVEALNKFARSYQLKREPLQEYISDPMVVGPINIVSRWLVRSKTGEVIIAGTTAPNKEGKIVLPVGGDLFPGTYIVEAEVLIDGNAMNVKTISLSYTVPD